MTDRWLLERCSQVVRKPEYSYVACIVSGVSLLSWSQYFPPRATTLRGIGSPNAICTISSMCLPESVIWPPV